MYTTNVRIRFVDTDMSERIHYSAIFRYFEILDHEFFREIGYPFTDLFKKNLDMPRVHVECNYLGSIWYDDELKACASIAKLGNSSFTYSFQFFKEDQLMVKGSMTVVMVNRTTGKKESIPDFLRKELEKHIEKIGGKDQ